MHILIAPNAFKNSLDAPMVAEAINNGLKQSSLSCKTTLFPVGDGGDGTASLLIDHLKAKNVSVNVLDPLRRKITSSFGWSEQSKTVIIELAAASGLRLLKQEEYDPLSTTSFGTGELIIEALNRNAKKIILCIGGSATVDGGTGILEAIGIRFLDKNNDEMTHLPASLQKLSSIDTSKLNQGILQTQMIILCDVENTLLGTNGAARIFGPQKGASGKDIELLEARLKKLNDVVFDATGKDMSGVKHGGAAGGVAASLHALINAELVNGIDHFLEITGFENELRRADLVITGEGSIDAQTLRGKGPFGVAKKAKEFSLPVVGLAGKIPDIIGPSLQEYFDQLISINNTASDLDEAIRNTYANLVLTARKLGDAIAATKQD